MFPILILGSRRTESCLTSYATLSTESMMQIMCGGRCDRVDVGSLELYLHLILNWCQQISAASFVSSPSARISNFHGCKAYLHPRIPNAYPGSKINIASITDMPDAYLDADDGGEKSAGWSRQDFGNASLHALTLSEDKGEPAGKLGYYLLISQSRDLCFHTQNERPDWVVAWNPSMRFCQQRKAMARMVSANACCTMEGNQIPRMCNVYLQMMVYILEINKLHHRRVSHSIRCV